MVNNCIKVLLDNGQIIDIPMANINPTIIGSSLSITASVATVATVYWTARCVLASAATDIGESAIEEIVLTKTNGELIKMASKAGVQAISAGAISVTAWFISRQCFRAVVKKYVRKTMNAEVVKFL